MILVVNADDAGIDAARNRGILEAARHGLVRSASLLVTAPAAVEFARSATAAGILSVGLHANFSAGKPLVAGHRSLVGPEGCFVGKRELWRRARTGGIDVGECRRELAAQLETIQALGIVPSHVDGHNHAHLFPGIAEAVAEIVPPATWVRQQRGAMPADAELPQDLYADSLTKAHGLALLTARSLALGWRRFRAVDRFLGIELPPGYGPRDLIALLAMHATSPAEIVEVMTHPGFSTSDSVPFSASPDRERELRALTDAELLSFATRSGLELRGFAFLP